MPFLCEANPYPGIALIRARAMRHEFRRHTHRSHLFGVVVRGGRQIETAHAHFEIAAGEGFCLPAGLAHRCAADKEHDYRVAAVDPVLWARLGGAIPVPARLTVGSPALLAVRRLMIALCRPNEAMAVETALLAVHGELPGGALVLPTRPEQAAMVSRLRDWLDAHCSEVVSLETLAAVASCSPSLANRLFRQLVGIPPYEYLLQRRLSLAATRLRSGNQALADLAAECGFADQSHFQRLFRRAYGTTPAAYRKASAPLLMLSPD